MQRIFVALPWLSLIICGLSWLRFGIDLPLGDDWGTYIDGTMRSFKLSYLFAHGNDTLYPVGKILDTLAYRLIDGNTIAYQFISMIGVLGLLLLLQWKLLSFTLKDKTLAASAFSLTILMLQPDTYWGWQNLAYHQALPLLACLTSLYIVLVLQWKPAKVFLICLVLGLLGGFSYISGAFASLTLGFVMIISHQFWRGSDFEKNRLRFGGLGLLISGLISTAAQVWVIASIQKGTHVPGLRMALPTEIDFWLFMMGKIARSMMLPINKPAVALVLTLTAVALVCFFLIFIFRMFYANRLEHSAIELRQTSLVFMALTSVVFVYLVLISAGRAHMRPADDLEMLKVFGWGFHRFHFFWVTLLWPWLLAMVFVYTKSKNQEVFLNRLIWVIPVIALLWSIYAGALNHGAFFKTTQNQRAEGLQCLQLAMQSGDDVKCWQLLPIQHPLKQGILNGQKTGASFARLLPAAQK